MFVYVGSTTVHHGIEHHAIQIETHYTIFSLGNLISVFFSRFSLWFGT